jgi:hypothetical protein
MASALPLLSPSEPHDSTTVSTGSPSVASRQDAMAGCIVLTLPECRSRDDEIPRSSANHELFQNDLQSPIKIPHQPRQASWHSKEPCVAIRQQPVQGSYLTIHVRVDGKLPA